MKPPDPASGIETQLDKSPDAFRTISEVAEDLDIPQHVLRFWETRFPQIRPLKRGGGRRYYRPDDVLLLQGIRRLLYGEGYTIKGVLRILKEQGVRQVQAIGRGAPLQAAGDHGPEAPEPAHESKAHSAPPAASRGDPHGADAHGHQAGARRSGQMRGEDERVVALKAVLFELGECRRVLGDALSPPQSGEELA